MKEIIEEFKKRLLAQIPDDVECEEPGTEMPVDPALAADQTRNHTLREVRAIIKKMQ